MSGQRGEEVRWLSTAQTSDRLGVPLRHLYRLIDQGHLPAYKFGRVIRLRSNEVDRWHRTR